MLQMESLILNFFLLILRISLNFCSDADHKGDRFSKVLPEKSFEFILSRRDGIVAFNLGFVPLLVKIDFILEKQGRKEDALGAHGIGHVKIVFAL